MGKTVLLPLLADGEFHSGQELAGVLGVSRTAVWKQLEKLRELGLQIESVRGKGYRIRGGMELLEASRIEAGLTADSRRLLAELVVADVLDSTNAEVLRRMERGGPSGLACVAEQQTAGRGRRGRQWVSPYAGNIYLSLGWEFAGGAAALEGLSLACSRWVCRMSG
jgi:BirA family biotin operon repressor/biotin-[acetyl-CoA-carboxylase] ligase